MRPRVRTHTGRRDDHTDLCVAGRARASRIRAPETGHPRGRRGAPAVARHDRRVRPRRVFVVVALAYAALVSTLAGAAFAARDLASARAALAGSGPWTKALTRAFDEAMSAGSDFAKADEAWTKAIAIAPTNAAAWSNRGTKRLQAGRWADARDDLERSVELSPDPDAPDPLTLNNLGNAEGALGRWDAAMANYLEASKDRDGPIAPPTSLAKFQVGQVDDAVRTMRTILRRDPEFWDMRAARRRSSGRAATRRAETEWAALSPGGAGAAARRAARGAGSATPAYAGLLGSSSSSRLRSSAAWSAATARAGTGARAGREISPAGGPAPTTRRARCTPTRKSSRRGGRRGARRRSTRSSPCGAPEGRWTTTARSRSTGSASDARARRLL